MYSFVNAHNTMNFLEIKNKTKNTKINDKIEFVFKLLLFAEYGIETSTGDLNNLSNLSISNLRTTTSNIATTSTSTNPSYNHKSTDDYCLYKYNELNEYNHLCKEIKQTLLLYRMKLKCFLFI